TFELHSKKCICQRPRATPAARSAEPLTSYHKLLIPGLASIWTAPTVDRHFRMRKLEDCLNQKNRKSGMRDAGFFGSTMKRSFVSELPLRLQRGKSSAGFKGSWNGDRALWAIVRF